MRCPVGLYAEASACSLRQGRYQSQAYGRERGSFAQSLECALSVACTFSPLKGCLDVSPNFLFGDSPRSPQNH